MTALDRLMREDPVGQLRRQEGSMARLGSEDKVPKLDWVEGVGRLLAHDTWLDDVEREAVEMVERGIRHVIWSGMGGSVMTVRVLIDLGFFPAGGRDAVTVYPLDSTDPAAINSIIRSLADAHGIRDVERMASVPPGLLDDVMMIAVSMGMTSEEPMTHLEWFLDLLQQAELSAPDHVVVMTLPDSFLDGFARERNIPRRALQLDDGSGTGGRMSAPSTRVFLLPAALALYGALGRTGGLKAVLDRAWNLHDIALAEDHPSAHPFVRLAARLSDASVGGACAILLSLPAAWRGLLPWVEQLLEESLGKSGKGIVVFEPQELDHRAPCFVRESQIVVAMAMGDEVPAVPPDASTDTFAIHLSYGHEAGIVNRLAATAAMFLGWQLTMALYGYLENITFAGQPAVEQYKARARALRRERDHLEAAKVSGTALPGGPLTLLSPPSVDVTSDASYAALAAALRRDLCANTGQPRYLDLTANGEFPADTMALLRRHIAHIGNDLVGVPVKIRRAPAAYHSTEQSEMDGPAGIVSLRLVAREHERTFLGSYTDTFVNAQAMATWQAMVEQRRTCFLLVMNGPVAEMTDHLEEFCRGVMTALS